MKASILVIAVAAALTSPASFASKELAEKKGCLACHSLEQDSVFPSYRKIAAKYAGDKDAAARLVQTVLKGNLGKPVWGSTGGMPPQAPAVSEAEAKQLVQWILGLK